MNPKEAARQIRIGQEKIQRARELIAHADLTGVTMDWEGEFMTFCPMDGVPQRFIQEATILSAEIKALKEGRIK